MCFIYQAKWGFCDLTEHGDVTNWEVSCQCSPGYMGTGCDQVKCNLMLPADFKAENYLFQREEDLSVVYTCIE